MTSENFRTNPMFLRNQFKGDGIFDIPLLQTDEIDLEEIELIGYDKLCDNKTEAIVHFFMDDYKFEAMWKDPEPRIERLKEYKAVLTPDFSMYTEMPLRDAERFVRGSDGRTYYTPDHYNAFHEIID